MRGTQKPWPNSMVSAGPSSSIPMDSNREPRPASESYRSHNSPNYWRTMNCGRKSIRQAKAVAGVDASSCNFMQ